MMAAASSRSAGGVRPQHAVDPTTANRGGSVDVTAGFAAPIPTPLPKHQPKPHPNPSHGYVDGDTIVLSGVPRDVWQGWWSG